ncbi:hypothetical protein EDC01DRAFT_657187 [Geopyxis carbonaria]|nr:hypothetical protein EDC01DRAFT_657187 [Geopyxis carbonaria]
MGDLWRPYIIADTRTVYPYETRWYLLGAPPQPPNSSHANIETRNMGFFEPQVRHDYWIREEPYPEYGVKLLQFDYDNGLLEDLTRVYGTEYIGEKSWTPTGLTLTDTINFVQMLGERKYLEGLMTAHVNQYWYRNSKLEWEINIRLEDARYLHQYLVWEMQSGVIAAMSDRVAKVRYIFDTLLRPARDFFDILRAEALAHAQTTTGN